MPGSICYGRGGERVTLSDANMLPGRLDPAAIPGVDWSVESKEVEGASASLIGQFLGLDPYSAA